MAGVNKVILLGNLGKDPEIRVLEGGSKVARFPLATSERYKDRNGQVQESTEWHNVEFWGNVVDVIERYVKKGDRIYVEGSIRTRSFEDKEGNKRYITEIRGRDLNLLGGSGGNSAATETTNSSKAAGAPPAAESGPDEDLPF